jgi:outer membrane immunogenic protein
MLRRLILVSVSVIGCATAVSAADLYAPPAPAVVAAPCCAPIWAGLYVGANLGGSWLSGNASYSQFGGNGLFSTDLSDGSFIGGGQIGYNWQSGLFVLGIETDIAGRDNSERAVRLPFAGNTIDAVALSQRDDLVGTFRGRIGYVTGNWLLYATGGLAYGEVEHKLLETRLTVPGQLRSVSDSATNTGWTVGGGVEWAISPRWSVGVEYLHIDLGTTTLFQGPSVVGGLTFPASAARFEDTSDIVRARLNFHIPEYITNF